MKVYVMRHGTTVWNEKGIIQGRSNNRLSQNGKILTEEVSQKYKDTKFDIIFCSPLMRTMQTANIMNKWHNVKIIKDERLIEINQGIFAKRLKASLTNIEKQQRQNREKSCGMEKYEDDLFSTNQRQKSSHLYENYSLSKTRGYLYFIGRRWCVGVF